MHSFGGREPNGVVVSFQLTPAPGCGSAENGEEFDVFSPTFRRLDRTRHVSLRAEGLHSRVAVKLSAIEAEHDFYAFVCDNAHNEELIRSARHQVLPSPLPGVRVFGTRDSRTASRTMFGTAKVTLYSDRFIFVVGPAEIVLAVTSAPRPPRAELERSLLSLLYRRAEAHKL
jgi:hypothetical protein